MKSAWNFPALWATVINQIKTWCPGFTRCVPRCGVARTSFPNIMCTCPSPNCRCYSSSLKMNVTIGFTKRHPWTVVIFTQIGRGRRKWSFQLHPSSLIRTEGNAPKTKWEAWYKLYITLLNRCVSTLPFNLKMLFLVLSSLLAATTWAQTPPGFSPDVTTHLDVIYPSATITPGLQMQKAGEFQLSFCG